MLAFKVDEEHTASGAVVQQKVLNMTFNTYDWIRLPLNYTMSVALSHFPLDISPKRNSINFALKYSKPNSMYVQFVYW